MKVSILLFVGVLLALVIGVIWYWGDRSYAEASTSIVTMPPANSYKGFSYLNPFTWWQKREGFQTTPTTFDPAWTQPPDVKMNTPSMGFQAWGTVGNTPTSETYTLPTYTYSYLSMKHLFYK